MYAYARFTRQIQEPKERPGAREYHLLGGGHIAKIKSTTIDSLGIALMNANGKACGGQPSTTCIGIADFCSKANLTDTTSPLAPVDLVGYTCC